MNGNSREKIRDLACKRDEGEKRRTASSRNQLQTQPILIELLALSTKNKPLKELLQDFLLGITSFPWLELEEKGAVLLVDEHHPQRLLLTAHHNLAPPLQKIRAEVPFGRCLCGLAAQRKEVPMILSPGGTSRSSWSMTRVPWWRSPPSRLQKLGYTVTARTSSIEALEAFRAHPDKFQKPIDLPALAQAIRELL